MIRNTGHDFLGRSTGWSSLIVNTFALKNIEFIDEWAGPEDYSGGAVKIGAGVQGYELWTEAFAQTPPVGVVTGECETVGIAGGLVAGGGHGPFSTLHGLVADNALEFEAVSADGQFVVANADDNPDLFYALKGGGPSSYAAVTSITFRTYPEDVSAGGELFINSTIATEEQVWEGIRIFHKHSNHLVDNGLYVYFEIAPFTFRVKPFVALGQTGTGLREVLAPLLGELRSSGIPFAETIQEYDTFFELYRDLFEGEFSGDHSLTGGWTFTHEDVAERNDAIIDAFKLAQSPRADLQYNGILIGHLLSPGYGWPSSNSATHPKWRNMTDLVITIVPVPIGASLKEKAELEDLLTNTVDAAMREAGPDGFAYINE